MKQPHEGTIMRLKIVSSAISIKYVTCSEQANWVQCRDSEF